MKDLGYGRGYRYAFDDPAAFTPQDYLPENVAGSPFYLPGEFGYERRIAERLEWWRARVRGEAGGDSTA